MSSPDFQRSKEVFQTALSRAPGSREAFLDEACGGDGELRREVERLLAAHDRARGFLSSPAGLDTPHHEERSEHTAGPQRIGPYAMVGTIARGGMGTVYRAVRDDDAFRKTVALKVVSGGRHSQYFAQRFRQERQILAQLQHPNIATVLDGGTAEDGQPYLVMEYVEGQPITEYCARRALGARERAALFRTVCGAVHYAHQNLVVHRDIKPANVLVDAHGVPKLLDFGIAKLLASGVDPDVAPTATVLPMMTPEYASPEQVKGETVTTASDVYSLGVLLYELLAGRRPYEVNTDSLAAIVRTVCETEPKAPSEVAGAETVKTLRGDLDTIVLKALRKEPGRRYPSAHELSEDVRRCLEGLPVTARPDTLRYRAGKFVQRHRTGVAAAAIVVLVLLGGLAATIRQRRIAERRFDQVRSLATFVMFDMHDAIAGLPGATPARKQLVERALQYLDGLAAETAADAALRAEIAKGYERLGKIQGGPATANLGDRAGARASLQKAIAIRERLAASGGDAAAVAALAVAWGELARVHFSEEKHDEAGAALARMKVLLGSLSAETAKDPRVLYAWQHCHDLEAMTAEAAGDGVGLRDARARQLQMAKTLLEKDPADAVRQRNVALAHKYLAGAMHRLDELGPARAHYEEARRLDRLGVETQPMNANRKLDLSFSHAGVASVLRDEGDLDGARAAYGEALRLRQEVFASDPANEFSFKALVRAHRSLAEVSAHEGDADGALSHQRVALALRRQWESTHPSRHGNAEWDARHQWDLGDLRVVMAGRPRLPPSAQRAHWLAARSHYAQALATWQALGATTPLEGEYAAYPERLAKEVAKCDAALLRLGG